MRRRQLKYFIKVGLLLIIGLFIILLLKSGLKSDESDHLIQVIPKKVQNAHENIVEAAQLNIIQSIEENQNKKDWHDHDSITRDLNREGMGEQGKKARLENHQKSKEDLLFRQNGFNAMLSDSISVNRSVPDIRNIGCKSKKYLNKLPKASIIFIYYDEYLSVLLRSIYSVLNRSPPELIEEIILVDDCSDRDYLKKDLDDYIENVFSNVKVIRLEKRTGLIGARTAGAKAAKGDVLIFFDSHIETNYNWLPPLLEPIAINPKASVCPFIDVIDHTDFEYRAQDEGARGAFDWQFYYKRLPLLPEDVLDKTKPFKSPIMAGGLFAIGREFFWELGGYDDGLDIWGGEQYELSFKIWMCGGELLDAPCSRVAHIYRGPMDQRKNPRTTDYVHKNYKRVAEVWMDEYKQYIYDHDPGLYERIDAGDLTVQQDLRVKNKCKSFKWFMETVAFDLMKVYPPVEPPDYASGILKSLASENLCVDTLNARSHSPVGLYPCASDKIHPQHNQYWSLSWHRDIRLKFRKSCLDVADGGKNAPAKLWECHGQGGNQFWYYDNDKKLVQHGSRLDRCLEADVRNRKVYVNSCDENNISMKWEFGYVNVTGLRSFNKNDREF